MPEVNIPSPPGIYIYYICCCCSVTKSCLTLCNPMNCSTSGFPVLHSPSLLKLTSVKSVMPSNHLILGHPLLLPSIFPSIRVFSNESAVRIRWPKYWSFSFSISPSSEYSGLISFMIDWFDILYVQGTLKSLLQHPSLNASILWHPAFFMVQLSHLYTTTGKTIVLTMWAFVSIVMSLLSNILSRCLKTFLPRRKSLLISWLQSLSAGTGLVALNSTKRKMPSGVALGDFQEAVRGQGLSWEGRSSLEPRVRRQPHSDASGSFSHP